MKIFYTLSLALILSACSNSNETATENSNTEAVNNTSDYSVVDKFCGKWCAEDKPEEVITITKAADFDKTHNCVVNDGKTDVSFPFVLKENIFKLRQPEYWVQILHDEKANQLLWKIVRYDETEGKVVRKYNFKSQ